jgi:hypothetical protein
MHKHNMTLYCNVVLSPQHSSLGVMSDCNRKATSGDLLLGRFYIPKITGKERA